MGKPGAVRTTPGAILVVAGVAALALCITGFALHLVGFATDATITALLCGGSGLAWLGQDRRGQRRAANHVSAGRPASRRRADRLRRTTP